MAPIKLGKLVSVSSEDPSYPAENLLKHEYSKCKWKCKVAGEKQAVVEFQLEKPTKITAIDVGNEFSAFIEILVCKSCTPDDYKVLLVASSLMSLQDAKYGSNGNEVRFFKTENLTKPVADEKWDRLKVICTQPYNKMIQYGLCFIIIRSSCENDSSQDNALTLGKFKLKPESTVDPISVGSIFARRKELTQPELQGAAAIRAASLPNAVTPVPSSSLLNIDKKKENNKKQERKENKPVTNRHQKDAAGSTSVNGSLNKRNSYSSTPKKSPKKIKHTDVDPKNKPRREKKWDKLLDDVVFVISGFQNPLRADIRSKALAMGAKYKADWDSSCTHLVCAFTNTPKFNQVRGSGKIVKKDWIEECYSKRMRFPWRRFALDKSDLSEPVSEDEIYEEVASTSTLTDHRRTLNDSSSEDTEDEIERVRKRQKIPQKLPVKKLKVETKTEESNDFSKKTNLQHLINKTESEGTSTKYTVNESEHQKNEVRSSNGPKKETVSQDDVYDMDTEEENTVTPNDRLLPPLSDIYEDLIFHISENLKSELITQLKRYIIAHKGKVNQDISNDVSFVICEPSENLQELKEKYPDPVFIEPEWIWKSHDENKLLPTSKFEI